MISIECRDLKDLKLELAAYLSEKVPAVPAIKTKSIVLDPLEEDSSFTINEVSLYVRMFLARKDLLNDFAVTVDDEKITVKTVSERKIDVKKVDSGLLVCPHCGKVTPYEEEMNVHVKAHYLI